MGGFHTKEEGTGPGGSTHRGVDDQTTTAQDDQITIADGEVVINEDGDDLDFRIESENNANMLVVDGENDRIGIGTAAPAVLLTTAKVATDNSSSSDATLANSFVHLGQGEYGSGRYYLTTYGYSTGRTNPGAYVGALGAQSAGYGKYHLVLGTRDATTDSLPTERMRIATTGKVGIGITAPQKDLSVSGGGSDGTLQLTTTANGVSAVDGFQLACATSGAAVINQREAADLTIYVNGALAMTYQDGGNVGVGTSSPDANFQVAQPTAGIGTVTITSTTTCTGTGTQFLNTFKVGDNIILTTNAETRAITAIASDTVMTIAAATNVVDSAYTLAGGDRFSVLGSGNVGVGTTAPGQLLDVNQGGGNMIADGYDNHSLAAYKENIDSAPGYLSNLVACSPKQWNPLPFISADEIKAAVFEHFGEDVLVAEAVEAKEAVYETDDETGEEIIVEKATEAREAVYERQCPQWDAYFPESNSHRNKALYDMPEGEMKTWIDTWCETKRVGMRQEPKWQKKRIGLVADGEATAEHLPELIAHDSDGAPVGISTMPYIGMLHSAIIELAAKVEELENK